MVGAMITRWGVRRGFAMMERKDLAGMTRLWADNSVFEFPGTTPISGRHEGKPAVEAFFRTIFDRMATVHVDIKRIALAHPYALGLSNTVFAEWAMDETSHDGVTIHVEGVSITELRRGKAIAGRDYFFDTKPLEVMWGHRESAEAAVVAAGRP